MVSYATFAWRLALRVSEQKTGLAKIVGIQALEDKNRTVVGLYDEALAGVLGMVPHQVPEIPDAHGIGQADDIAFPKIEVGNRVAAVALAEDEKTVIENVFWVSKSSPATSD